MQPFQQFVEEHATSVWRFIAVRVDRRDVDDVFQDTLLAALRTWPDLDNEDNLRGWLFTIARSKVVDHYRVDGRRPIPVEDVPADTDDPVQVPDPDLWELVGGLPDKQHQAVHHRFVEDLAYADIAEAMDTSEAAARQNVYQALKKLRARWKIET